MKSVLIANRDENETKKIEEILSKDYEVLSIHSQEEMNGFLEKCDTLLVDHNFTDNAGIDFLMDVMSKSNLPVLMMTPPEDPNCAIEAIRLGAYSYLVKTGGYHDLLKLSLELTIDKFSEREKMKNTIVSLKRRMAELEQQLELYKREDSKKAPEQRKGDFLKEINARLKKGEIDLPSYPDINVKFKKLLEKGAKVAQISNLLRKDVSISSKLISISNSPYYRGLEENKSLEQAISRLGLATTKNCVAVISNRALYTTSNKEYSAYLKDLLEHSLSCAYASEFISKHLKFNKPDQFFTIGLLHDIGRLVLLQIFSELETRGVFGEEIDKTELFDTLNAYHGTFGAALLNKWKLPGEYALVSKYHGNLQEADPITKELQVVHLANLLVKTMGFGREGPEEIDLENADSARLLKMDGQAIAEARDFVKEIMESTSLI